jgi:phosphoribosylglycinamide formyltransferase 1
MKKIVILISGRGSNMQAIVQAVISNRADAAGLDYAASEGILTAVVVSKEFASRPAFDAALQAKIDEFEPDLVVLAGFMRILTAEFVEHYANRIINIHPSLLPNFVGLETHQQALDAGVKVHGATVHFVTPQLDHGPIIAQAVVPVTFGDTPEVLAQRVLAQEHVIYPQAVRLFVEGKLTVVGNAVRID